MSGKIAIIGAGIAGLACARVLADSGVSVVVFEKSRGLGGRMATRRGDDWQCDHGAQYFTARDADFRAQVEVWQAAGVVARWEPAIRVLGEATSTFPGENPARYVGTPSMNAPARWLADGLTVHRETRIGKISRQAGGWQLTTTGGEPIDAVFSAVVLAIPPAQAVPLLQGHDDVLAAVADAQSMRPCWAVMAEYAEPPAAGADALFINSGPLRWAARDSSKPGRPAGQRWLLHANADWSQAQVETPPEAVAEALCAAFSALGAGPAIQARAHRWLYADAAQYRQDGHLWQASTGLGLCGDWLNGGKVEGAWLSGRGLGLALLDTRSAGKSG